MDDSGTREGSPRINGVDSTKPDTQRELRKIAKAIRRLDRELCHTLDDDPNLPRLFTSLGNVHDERFDLLGEQSDIDTVIKCGLAVLNLAPDNGPNLPALYRSLVVSYGKRFQHFGEMCDIEKSIEYGSIACSVTPAEHPDLSLQLANLGMAYRHRFQRLGELDDLKKAIDYDSLAFAMTSDDHPDFSSRLAGLGQSHSHRFQRLGELEDLEKAIEYESRALALTPAGHPDLAERLNNLGLAHKNRFMRLGELADLEMAIKFMSRAVGSTLNGHPHLPIELANLSAFHSLRFERLGEMDDLEKSIDYASRAVALIPDGHPDTPGYLTNIGASYGDRYARVGELDDIDKAITHHSRALSLTPESDPELPSRLTNLGGSHAIDYESRALALASDWKLELLDHLGNLAYSHQNRFLRLGEMEDLEKAIEYESRALDLTPEGHPKLSSHLASLASLHQTRSEHLGEPNDAHKAVEYQSRAFALTPDSHPGLSSRLASLGKFHLGRFMRMGELDDLEKALQHGPHAVALTPGDHPSYPSHVAMLAATQFFHSRFTGDASILQESLESLRIAANSLTGAPRTRFIYATLWGEIASQYSPSNCVEAYQCAMDLLPQFIWLGATTAQRYQDLSQAKTLAAEAASAAITSSNYPLALEWLEHARCVVWNQSLMLRSPFDELQSSHPSLAGRLQTIANQLHIASSESREALAAISGSMDPEQVAQEHRHLAKEYDMLLTQARALTGFENFLRPRKASELVCAARNGPIVVINCHDDNCSALVIRHVGGQDSIDHIPLLTFTSKKAQSIRFEMEMVVRKGRQRGVERRPISVSNQDDNFESVLTNLWHDIVEPVLEFLGYMKVPRDRDFLPHITWCPTGPLSFLPLHAAGDYNKPRSRVFDYVVSSYTPTLTALLASTPSKLTPDSRILAIGQANTPGHNPLPGTTDELARLKTHAKNRVEYSQLIANQATKTVVLDAMEQNDWVHLACHAHQNNQDPTKSGFFLHDDTLDLYSINKKSFKNKGLAFLSACQTATGDEELPDEAIHLASGMLMAGYTSVIATMWSVHDDDAPIVADWVYAQLMQEGKIGNGEVGKVLHNAIAELRNRVGENAFERWVPYIHVGS